MYLKFYFLISNFYPAVLQLSSCDLGYIQLAVNGVCVYTRNKRENMPLVVFI